MTWPAVLPRPERATWGLTPQDARRKRQSDAGPPAYRRRFSAAARMVTLSVLLSRSEKAVFDRFFHEDCAEGARLFHMPDPTTEGWPMLTSDGVAILSPSGAPILLSARWLCAWGEQMPAEAIVGREFRKTFGLVVLP